MYMTEKAANSFDWRLPLYGSLGAVIAVLPATVFGRGVGTFLGTALLGIVVGLILLVVFFLNVRRRSVAGLSMLIAFCGLAWMLFRISGDLHSTGRWLVQSKEYKAEVLAQPRSDNGEFKHLEWDCWGFAGFETEEYLVFDPDNSLAIAARSHSPGKYSGIPCEVPEVRRLESQWYTVIFYTNTGWNYCG
jgi:hypothetical protein